MIEATISQFGHVDILIANAAMTQAATFGRMELEEFKQFFDVSFLGTVRLLHAAWGAMGAQKYSRIITTTSSAGRYGNHGLSAYGVAKAAVEVLTRSLAFEGEKYNIKVEECDKTGEVFVAATNRIRRAYNVETPSVAIDQNNVTASIDELFTEVGVQHRTSNSAFASLFEEVLAE